MLTTTFSRSSELTSAGTLHPRLAVASVGSGLLLLLAAMAVLNGLDVHLEPAAGGPTVAMILRDPGMGRQSDGI